jgi:tRNA(Leu) C34 or U34 (ribose-2'-O)-methylase TrmL
MRGRLLPALALVSASAAAGDAGGFGSVQAALDAALALSGAAPGALLEELLEECGAAVSAACAPKVSATWSTHMLPLHCAHASPDDDAPACARARYPRSVRRIQASAPAAALGVTCALAGAALLRATAAAGDAEPSHATRFVTRLWLPLLSARSGSSGAAGVGVAAAAVRVDAAGAAALVAADAWPAVAMLLLACVRCLPQRQPAPPGSSSLDALQQLTGGLPDAQQQPLQLPAACAAAAEVMRTVAAAAAAGGDAARSTQALAAELLLPRVLGGLGCAPAHDASLLRALLPALVDASAAATGTRTSAAAALRHTACALLAPAAPPPWRAAGLALLVRFGADAVPPLPQGGASEDDDEHAVLWCALRDALWSADALPRKQALAALRFALGTARAARPGWATLLTLFHSLEDFSMHLLAPAFARIRALHPAAPLAAEGASPPQLPAVPYAWVAALWCRAVTHDNPLLRRVALAALAASEWRGGFATAMPEGVLLGPLLRALNDPAQSADFAGGGDASEWANPPPAAGVAAAAAAHVAAAAGGRRGRAAAARRVLAAAVAVPHATRAGMAALLAVCRAACDAIEGGSSEQEQPDGDAVADANANADADADTCAAADECLELLRRLCSAACAQWGAPYRAAAAHNALVAAAAIAPPPGITPAAAARLLQALCRGGALRSGGTARAAAAAWLAPPSGEHASWLADALCADVARFMKDGEADTEVNASEASSIVAADGAAHAHLSDEEVSSWRSRAQQLALLLTLLSSDDARAGVLAPLTDAAAALQRRVYAPRGQPERVLLLLEATLRECGDADAPAALSAAAQLLLAACIADVAAFARSAAAPLWARPSHGVNGDASAGAGDDTALVAPPRSRGASVGGGGSSYSGGPPSALAPFRASAARRAVLALAALAAAPRWRVAATDGSAASAAWAAADASLWWTLSDFVAASSWWADAAANGGSSAAAAVAELRADSLACAALAAAALVPASTAASGHEEPAQAHTQQQCASQPEELPPGFVPRLFEAVAAAACASGGSAGAATAGSGGAAARSAGGAAAAGESSGAARWRALTAVLRLPGASHPPGAAHAAALGAAVAALRVAARADLLSALRATRALLDVVLPSPPLVAAAAAAAAVAADEPSLCDLDGEEEETDEADANDASWADDDAAADAADDAALAACPATPLACALARCAWAGFHDADKWPAALLAELLATALHPSLFALTPLHARRHGPLRVLVRRLLRAGGRAARVMRLAAAALWALWLRCPGVAADARYEREMLRVALHGAASTHDADLADELAAPSGAAALAGMPGGGDVALLAAMAGEDLAALCAAVCGASALATASGADADAARAGSRLLVFALRAVNGDAELAAETYRRGSVTHARKIRAWQLIGALAPLLPLAHEYGSVEDGGDVAPSMLAAAVDGALWRALDCGNQPDVKQYAEGFAAAAALRAPALLFRRVLPPLLSPAAAGLPPHALASRLLVAHVVVCHSEAGAAQAAALPAVLAAALPQAAVHHHALRTLAQLVLHDLFDAFPPAHAAWRGGLKEDEAGATLGLDAGAAGAALASLRSFLAANADFVKTRAAFGRLAPLHPRDACAPAALLAGASAPGGGSSGGVLRFEGAPEPLAERVASFLDACRDDTRAGRAAAEGALHSGGSAAAPASSAPAPPLLDALQKKMSPVEALAAALAGAPGGEGSADGHAPGGDADADACASFGGALRAAGAAAAAAPRQELIICASLVDNPANVGGLARTSEVFRLARLVVNDASMLKQALFKQLAVTADKWLPVSAVSPAALPAYLAAKRADGYALVALEQTTGSAPLPGYAWPRRTLLLLGAEGSGVPAELLPLLDAAVEIPQLGLVRSLNVHVSGALAAYAYTCQHAAI